MDVTTVFFSVKLTTAAAWIIALAVVAIGVNRLMVHFNRRKPPPLPR